MRLRLFSVCLGCVWFTVVCGYPWLLSAQMRAKGIYIPIFLEPEPKAVAVVRIKETFTEYPRHGFFRIGLLPKLVAEGVTLELRQTEVIANALREAQRGILGGKSAAYLDVREVSVKLSAGTNLLIQARRLRFGEAGQWQFEDGVVFPNMTNHVPYLKGTLQTAGAAAGQFTFQNGGSSTTFNLFSLVPPKFNAMKNEESP